MNILIELWASAVRKVAGLVERDEKLEECSTISAGPWWVSEEALDFSRYVCYIDDSR
jgi:hypothetical protein